MSETVVEDPSLRTQRRGWYFYDWATSAFNTTVITVFLGPYLTDIARRGAGPDGLIEPFGISMRPEAYFPYLISLSVIGQLIALPIAGAIADHSHRKKQLLAVLAYTGALATLAMYFLQGTDYVLGGVLLLIGNIAFGAAMVVYNAFLPELAGPDERDAVSSRGWAVGYLGGGLLLVINLGLFLGHEAIGLEEGHAVRLCLASAGLWWGLFTLVPLRALRNKGRPPEDETAPRAVTASFTQLGRTLAGLRKYPRTLLFLLAFIIYNDGVQTVISFSATYADQELKLDQTVQIGAILMVQFVAFGGALWLGRLARRFGTKRTVIASLVVWTLTVLVAYVLQAGQAWQFFALAFVIAIVLGGSQALSRSLFSQLIPAGKEGEYFSLYEISDKGSAMLGAFVLGLALDVTGSYRAAIVSIAAFFVVGIALLVLVNLPRGIREAGNPVPERI
ncbi:MAG: MFS transporter [Streptosporangiales bacterium]|nr:MFS transporter [Streptosporangiales bacterium]